MNLPTVVEMAAEAHPDRAAVTSLHETLTFAELDVRSTVLAHQIADARATGVLYIAANGAAFPVALFAAAKAAVPFVPLNYRLGDAQLRALRSRHPGAVAISVSDDAGVQIETTGGGSPSTRPPLPVAPHDDVAVMLYTSGTTGTPKAALLRHRHLCAYVFGTVEFGAAGEADAALIAVPPYHVAGVANLLTNLYAGRRVVYMDGFDPAAWLETVTAQGVSHAMVVPTMLARLVTHLDGQIAHVPSLRTLSYGGSRMPIPVLERALHLFPDVSFVNAYGLTETSSTIALLGPEDHRAALGDDPRDRRRLASVGRPIPGVEVQIRDENGRRVATGTVGTVHVRGEQISGEYESGSAVDDDGWFATRDIGWMDDGGYLFVEGRVDDTIIRGGENVAPAEIEDVLMTHPGVAEAAVVGVPDDEWGQRIAAVVVPVPGATLTPSALQAHCREVLRSSKTPDIIDIRADLPRTPTGKVVRRLLVDELRR